jgi:hypothetical protein
MAARKHDAELFRPLFPFQTGLHAHPGKESEIIPARTGLTTHNLPKLITPPKTFGLTDCVIVLVVAIE